MKLQIEELAAQAANLSLEQLQEQKNLRDEEVRILRAEMAEIHSLMEPKWATEQALTAGPAHLRQTVHK